MMELVLTLVFSLVLLVFMAYPAMKIGEYLLSKDIVSSKNLDIITVILTIILSLMVAIFLKLW